VSYDAAAVVAFLRVLLCTISGKILLIWDGSPIHRAKEIKAFLKEGAMSVRLDQLAVNTNFSMAKITPLSW
jgi:hypothetical protein